MKISFFTCCRSSLTEGSYYINPARIVKNKTETVVTSPIRHIKIVGNKITYSEAVYLAVDTFTNKPKEEYNRRKYMRRLRFSVRLTLSAGTLNFFFLVCTFQVSKKNLKIGQNTSGAHSLFFT